MRITFEYAGNRFWVVGGRFVVGGEGLGVAAMLDDKEKHSDTDYPYPNLDPENTFRARIVGSIIVGLLVLWFFCSKLPDPKDFWTVFIGGAISYLILIMMVVQTRVSERQWQSMREGLDKTQVLIDQNERVIADGKIQETRNRRKTQAMIDAVQKQADIAEESLKLSEQMFYLAQRAHLAIKEIRLKNYPFEIGEKPIISMCIENGGNTPAFAATSWHITEFTRRTIEEFASSDSLDWGRAHYISSEIMGRGKSNLGIVHDPLTLDEMTTWEDGGNFFMGLRLEFSDIQEHKRSLVMWFEFNRELGCFVAATPTAESEEPQ